MKKIFRKNQLVITALALMIAVAGYFSYMNNNMEDGQVTAEASADAGTVQDLSLIHICTRDRACGLCAGASGQTVSAGMRHTEAVRALHID